MNIHIIIRTRLRSYSSNMADKQDRLQDSCGTHDLTIVPPITFGFVEDIIKGSSQSLGIKEVSKGYKYFSEKYVTNITGKLLNFVQLPPFSVYLHFCTCVNCPLH